MLVGGDGEEGKARRHQTYLSGICLLLINNLDIRRANIRVLLFLMFELFFLSCSFIFLLLFQMESLVKVNVSFKITK